ncbi:hypothetical protein ABG768_007020 [Culter alburnus]|uniref:Uncharacterized protein n=1 Tax=Culter alburnus TaxID=194366 RepID=A0AAW1ZU52_CULAL
MITAKRGISAAHGDYQLRSAHECFSVCVRVRAANRQPILQVETGQRRVLTRGSAQRSHLYGASVCTGQLNPAPGEKECPTQESDSALTPPPTLNR